jgi:subtilisin family serine protease
MPDYSQKLDARLRKIAATKPERLTELAKLGHVAARSAGPAQEVAVLVEFDGSANGVAELQSAGLTVTSVHGSVAVGWISIANLPKLAGLDVVRQVEAAQSTEPELNVAIPSAKGLAARRLGYTGEGVVVAIVDSGINWKHPDFLIPGGGTRIIALWDQGATPSGGQVPPQSFTYGVQYDSNDIDAALAGEPNAPTVPTDTSGHGTHVAGIAAGNGTAVFPANLAANFAGVAPSADLLIVKVDGHTNHTLDAFAWCREMASEAGCPVAINYSRGSNLGPHDGTSLFEKGVDGFLTSWSSGVVLIKSAGNEANKRKHVVLDIPATSAQTVGLKVSGNTSYIEIQFWYSSNASIDTTIIKGTSTWDFPAGAIITEQTAQGDTISVSSDTVARANNSKLIDITISHTNGAVQPGNWSIRLTVTTAFGNTQVNGWMKVSKSGKAIFTGGSVTRFGTITEPGNAYGILTVGSYVTRDSGTASINPPPQVTPRLSDFSGRGPTRDGRVKPDICAPGNYIYSANNKFTEDSTTVLAYTEKRGTSMAAPMVTGAAALLQQAFPAATQADIKSALYDTAVRDAITGRCPNNEWGNGRLDIEEAITDVIRKREDVPRGSDYAKDTSTPMEVIPDRIGSVAAPPSTPPAPQTQGNTTDRDKVLGKRKLEEIIEELQEYIQDDEPPAKK